MLALYNEFSSDELEQEVIIEKASIAVDKAILAYNTFMEMKEIKLREAELQCISESGGYEELVSFYEKEEEQSQDKEKGLLKNIWDKIIEFCKKIKNFLFGEGNKEIINNAKKDNETDVEIDQGVWTALTKFKTELKDGHIKFKEFISENKGKVALGLLGGSVAAISTGVVITVKRNKIGSMTEFFAYIVSTFEQWAENIKNKANEVMAAISSIFGKGDNISSKLSSLLNTAIGKVKTFGGFCLNLCKKTGEFSKKKFNNFKNKFDLDKELKKANRQINNITPDQIADIYDQNPNDQKAKKKKPNDHNKKGTGKGQKQPKNDPTYIRRQKSGNISSYESADNLFFDDIPDEFIQESIDGVDEILDAIESIF